MKQMKASAWERMGLVIGGGMGAGNPAKETAKATKQTVEILKAIYKGLVPRSGGGNTFTPAQSHV